MEKKNSPGRCGLPGRPGTKLLSGKGGGCDEKLVGDIALGLEPFSPRKPISLMGRASTIVISNFLKRTEEVTI